MQIISKNGKVYGVVKTGRHYPADIVKEMKAAGYQVKTIKEKNDEK